MPHQCLQCSQTFPEGSKDLLRGCPGCGGTRFFFTQSALAGKDLEEKREEAKHDIRAVVQAILSESASPAEAVKRLQEDGVIEASQEAVDAALKASAMDSEDALAPSMGTGRKASRKTSSPVIEEQPERVDRPETVTIADTGQYEIDVEGLMNASPIVIQKDGVFMIHLPSVFDGNGKRGAKRRS